MSKSSSIWIVDDDQDDQFFIETALREILPAVVIKQLYDGVNLIANLNQAGMLPKLLLLDLNMPFKSGLEALQELRQEPNLQHLLVIVLTTSDAAEQKQTCLALGANGF